MANSINSISTGTGGLQSTADGTSGNLLIQKDAGTIATFSSTGVVVSGVVAATTLTGDGSALTGISSGGMTLLSTVATTSGTSNATGTLNLTGFSYLFIDLYSVSPAVNISGYLQFTPNGGTGTYYIDTALLASVSMYGCYLHNLDSGQFFGGKRAGGGGGIDDTIRNGVGGGDSNGQNTGLSTSTTSIAFDWTTGEAFDNGVIRVYGLK